MNLDGGDISFDPPLTKKTPKTKADLNEAMQRLGIIEFDSTRYTVVSGGGDASERSELRSSQRSHKDTKDIHTPKSESEKSRKSGGRRVVYWFGNRELEFVEGANYIHLVNCQTEKRIGLARYFACTDNVHSSKFTELMLVEDYGNHSIRQIPFPFCLGFFSFFLSFSCKIYYCLHWKRQKIFFRYST